MQCRIGRTGHINRSDTGAVMDCIISVGLVLGQYSGLCHISRTVTWLLWTVSYQED